MRSSSEPERGALSRARDRWRRQESDAGEAQSEATVVTNTEEPPPSSPAEPAPAKAAPSPSAKRSAARDFVRANARVLGALALLVVGVLLVILGWYGTAYTNILTEQIPYLISGGLLGVALIIVAGFLASSASLERENRELRRDLVRAISSMRLRGPSSEPENDEDVPAEADRVFTVPGGRSYHVAGCPIVEGKQSRAVTLRAAMKSGLGACKLCGPE